MARKKRKTSSIGPAPWLNTFADLMNLLLCFFVMLFAFSDINIDKFEQVSISMANSIGITKDNSNVDSDKLISPGMSQIIGLEQYYSELRVNNDGLGTSTEDDTVSTDTENVDPSQSSGGTKEVEIDEALSKIQKEMAEATAVMYDEVSDLAIQYNLADYVELSIDPNSKYVQLTLNGSILYDSGEAEIKKEALPILTRIGRILKSFDGYSVEITGHTDNVPMSDSSQYKDNNWLSSARALNAAQYLINKCEIDPATLKYSGRGEYEPISSNATEEGRAKNRRIEIKIYNEYSSE